MSKMSSVLRSAEGDILMFWCPGCDGAHGIRVGNPGQSPATWNFNGNYEKPTFRPSILVTRTYGNKEIKQICHSYVTDGKIQFLPDCTHQYAGATLDLPSWPWDDSSNEE